MHLLIALCPECEKDACVGRATLELYILPAQACQFACTSPGIERNRKQGIIAQSLGRSAVDAIKSLLYLIGWYGISRCVCIGLDFAPLDILDRIRDGEFIGILNERVERAENGQALIIH